MRKNYYQIKHAVFSAILACFVFSCSKSGNSGEKKQETTQDEIKFTQELLPKKISKEFLGTWKLVGIMDTNKTPLNESNISSFETKRVAFEVSLDFSSTSSRDSKISVSKNENGKQYFFEDKINAVIYLKSANYLTTEIYMSEKKIKQEMDKLERLPKDNPSFIAKLNFFIEIGFLKESFYAKKDFLKKDQKIYVKRDLSSSPFSTPAQKEQTLYYVFEKQNK